MSTLLHLRDQIILDTNISGHPLFAHERLNRMINLAQRSIQSQLHGLGMKKWESHDPLTLTYEPIGFAGNPVMTADLSVDCPNMLESPNSIIFIETITAAAVFGVALEVDIKEFSEQLGNTYLSPTAAKPMFIRLENKVYISPSSVTIATALYYKIVADLLTDTSETEIPSEFEEFIIKKVSLEVEAILGKIQEKQIAEQQLDKEIAKAYQDFLNKQIEAERPKLNHTVLQ